jgi:hypothetical protein
MTYRFEHIGEVATSMILNSAPPGECYTVPIVGVPRGGTTMVAAVVDALGVDLGPRTDLEGWHFEDQTMHSPYIAVQVKYAKQRDLECPRWGWKDPVGLSSVRNALFALRNPRIIIVFRDPLATIQGEMRFDEVNDIQPRRTLASLVKQTTDWLAHNLEFSTITACPTLLVSYERALNYPERFVAELSGFLGVEPTAEQRAEALSRIERRGGYIVFGREEPVDSHPETDPAPDDTSLPPPAESAAESEPPPVES